MNEYPLLIVGFLLLAMFGLVSKRAERSPVTGPMVFLAAGILIGPAGLGLVAFDFDAELTRLTAEITLVVILFVDASMIPVTDLRRTLSGIPARLLLLGLPLTMALGFLLGLVVFQGLDPWLVALVALILSPTDAALGQAVVTSPSVPSRIRQSISIESGLNDGIALPLVLVAIAALADSEQSASNAHWLWFMAMQLTLGPLVGGLLGHFGGRLIDRAMASDWMEPAFQSLASITMALLAYVCAEAIGGNGFIAAFFAGLMLGTRVPQVRTRIQEFGEAEGQMLTLFVFLVLGLVAVPAALPYIDARTVLYAVLSLTVIRMLPVAVCLIGSGLDRYAVAFIGWFGPRGIASALYLMIAMADLAGRGLHQAAAVIVTTIVLSTLLHGITAVPMSNRFPPDTGTTVDDTG